MSNTINVQVKVSSNVIGTSVYAFGFANLDYDISTDSNIDTFREFVVTNIGSSNHTGICEMTSNVTTLNYHAGEGEEEFIGTLSQVFADVDSTDQDIVKQDNHTNYIYTAIRHGLNKSLWTIERASTNFVYYILLATTVGNVRGDMHGERSFLFNTAGYSGAMIWLGAASYLTTANGKILFGTGTTEEVINENFAMSSLWGSGNAYTSASRMATYYKSADPPPGGRMNEFYVFRTGGTSPITGFHMQLYKDSNWEGYDIEVKKVEKNPEFDAMFDAAILRPGNDLSPGAPFSDLPNADRILSSFELLTSLTALRQGVKYDIATNIATDEATVSYLS